MLAVPNYNARLDCGSTYIIYVKSFLLLLMSCRMPTEDPGQFRVSDGIWKCPNSCVNLAHR